MMNMSRFQPGQAPAILGPAAHKDCAFPPSPKPVMNLESLIRDDEIAAERGSSHGRVSPFSWPTATRAATYGHPARPVPANQSVERGPAFFDRRHLLSASPMGGPSRIGVGATRRPGHLRGRHTKIARQVFALEWTPISRGPRPLPGTWSLASKCRADAPELRPAPSHLGPREDRYGGGNGECGLCPAPRF